MNMLDYNNTAQQKFFESQDFGHLWLFLKQMILPNDRNIFLTAFQFQGKWELLKQATKNRGGLILVESGSRAKEGEGASVSKIYCTDAGTIWRLCKNEESISLL